MKTPLSRQEVKAAAKPLSPSAGNKLRIAILYSGLSGYTAACQRALKSLYDAELMVFHWPVAGEAPFQNEVFRHIDQAIDKSTVSRDEILRNLESFRPDFILMAGWMDADYLHVARRLKKKGIPVVAGSDTQWTGDLRQRIGQLIAPWYLHNAIDILWVSGERQRQLAWRLGFRGKRCLSGYYTCDWDRFAHERPRVYENTPKTMLYVGRYLPRKGVDLLVEAYRAYRQNTDRPWKLVLAGTGPLASLLQEEPGIEDRGFIQPGALPELLKTAGAFVLPSRKEPWGVALHEAAAARLPLISSDCSGAAVHLLRDGYNGFLFENGNAAELAEAMRHLTGVSPDRWEAMSEGSFALSRQYTPRQWARTLVEGVKAL